MERNDIENINSNQSKQCSYGGAKRFERGVPTVEAPAYTLLPNSAFYSLGWPLSIILFSQFHFVARKIAVTLR